MSGTEKEESKPSSSQNDFVIRDGFPALRNPADGSPSLNENEPIPRHEVWAEDHALEFRNLDDWWNDCAAVFTARTREDDQAYSAGTTYFLPCVMKPRCALEELVKSIFDKHTEHLEEGVIVREQSGAEWWTLIMDEDDTLEVNTEEDESDEVGMHFDADYGLEDQAPGLFLHPRVATVTYLSDFGAPTVVFDRKSPSMDDREMKQLEGDISKCWVSHPVIGKHLCFDGRLLHGAPCTFFPSIEHEEDREAKRIKLSRRRVTLLVNVWINHCPLDAEPLEDDICEKLASASKEGSQLFVWKKLDMSKPSSMKSSKLSVDKEDPAGEEEVVIGNRIVCIDYRSSMKALHKASRESRFTEIEVAKGALSIRVGEEVQSDDDEE